MCVLYSVRRQTCVLYYCCIYANVEDIWFDGMRCPLLAMQASVWSETICSNATPCCFQLFFLSNRQPLWRILPSDWNHFDISVAYVNRWINHRLATTPIQLLLLLLLNRNLKVVSGWNTCRPLLPDFMGHNFTAGRLTDTKTCSRVRWRCLGKDRPHFYFL